MSAGPEGDDNSLDGELIEDPGFAPNEPTDGRPIGSWRSRYTERGARVGIWVEGTYILSTNVVAIGLIMYMQAMGGPQWFSPSSAIGGEFHILLNAWLGGFFGGSLFVMKWMYHSVARGLWNQDRRLWRLFTPFLSAGVGLTVVALAISGIVSVFNSDVLSTDLGTLGISIFVGYFSDQIISRVAQIAGGRPATASRKKTRKSRPERET
jgi:hypothetical protein